MTFDRVVPGHPARIDLSLYQQRREHFADRTDLEHGVAVRNPGVARREPAKTNDATFSVVINSDGSGTNRPVLDRLAQHFD